MSFWASRAHTILAISDGVFPAGSGRWVTNAVTALGGSDEDEPAGAGQHPAARRPSAASGTPMDTSMRRKGAVRKGATIALNVAGLVTASPSPGQRQRCGRLS